MASEFEKLLAQLKAADEPKPKQRLLVKSGLAQEVQEAAALRSLGRPALGLLIKAGIDDAVRAGKLSGDTAMRGLRALGLDDDGKTPAAGDSLSASLSGLRPDQQRAAVDHAVRLGKISGAEAVACLRSLGLEP